MCVYITEHDCLPLYIMHMHHIPAAWIGTVSLHGSCHNPKFTLGFLYTQGSCLTTLHGLTRKQSYNNEEEVMGLATRD